ncbi:MAG: lytic transglycosylase domain-containing protein, partial [Bosea sp. (in: a-proteobacteria)]
MALPACAADDEARLEQMAEADPLDVQTTASLPQVPFTPLPEAEMAALDQALTHYRKGKLGEGDKAAESLADPAARALAEWVAIRSLPGVVRFERIVAFLDANPNFPGTGVFRRRAEEALVSEKRSHAVTRAFFHGREPLTPAGKVALARALADEGKAPEAQALIRAV